MRAKINFRGKGEGGETFLKSAIIAATTSRKESPRGGKHGRKGDCAHVKAASRGRLRRHGQGRRGVCGDSVLRHRDLLKNR